MAEQKSEENIVFLPWTVEPQPQTQAVILQQPSETHLRLDATTDKTAISSFALSVVIALTLGGFATWLAYWYGRKSFDLTKQSFDAVMAQIKSSEQVALDLNQRLFEQQSYLQKEVLNDQKQKYLRAIVASFLQDLDLFHKFSSRYVIKYGSLDGFEQFENSKIREEFEYIENLIESMRKKYIEIDLYFLPSEKLLLEEDSLIIDKCYELLTIILDDRSTIYDPTLKEIDKLIRSFNYKFKEFINKKAA